MNPKPEDTEDMLFVDEGLLQAAKAVAQQGLKKVTDIPGYPGMVVSLATDQSVSAVRFFSCDGVRYVIGSKRTA